MALRRIRVPFETVPKDRAFQQSFTARRAEEDAPHDRDHRVLGGLRADPGPAGASVDIKIPTFLGRRAKGWQVTTQSAAGTFHEIARDTRTVTVRWTPEVAGTACGLGFRVW